MSSGKPAVLCKMPGSALLVSLLLCSVMSLQPSAGCLRAGLQASLSLQQPAMGLQIPALPQSHDLLANPVFAAAPCREVAAS